MARLSDRRGCPTGAAHDDFPSAMMSKATDSRSAPGGVGAPRGTIVEAVGRATAVIVGAAVVGLLIGWLAEVIQSDYGFAPLVVFPMVVGVALGGALVGLARWLQEGRLAALVAGLAVAWLVALGAQHYLGYRQFASRWESRRLGRAEREAIEALRQAFPDAPAVHRARPPERFIDFLADQARQPRKVIGTWPAWSLWLFDAAVALAAAAAVLWPATQLPYCRRCRSWYRTIRAGRLTPGALAAVASLAGTQPPETPSRGQFRLRQCLGGCAPARLELAWRTAGGDAQRAESQLDAERLAAVSRALDARDVDFHAPDAPDYTPRGQE